MRSKVNKALQKALEEPSVAPVVDDGWKSPDERVLTTVRFLRSDHEAIKILAVQLNMSLTELVNQAVADYCATCGVTLQH